MDKSRLIAEQVCCSWLWFNISVAASFMLNHKVYALSPPLGQDVTA